jgi:hypothetical protein
VCGGGEEGERKGRGQETKGHPRIISIAVQGQTIHTFVSGEDNTKPGSIPGDTVIVPYSLQIIVKTKIFFSPHWQNRFLSFSSIFHS